MSNPHNLQVGQKLWFAYFFRTDGEPCFVTVSKVGRVWAEISGLPSSARVDMELLVVDSSRSSCVGKCYLTREEWQAEVELEKAWDRLRYWIGGIYCIPVGMTREKMAMIEALIGDTE